MDKEERNDEMLEPAEITDDELEELNGDVLPDREVMTILPVADGPGMPPGPATSAHSSSTSDGEWPLRRGHSLVHCSKPRAAHLQLKARNGPRPVHLAFAAAGYADGLRCSGKYLHSDVVRSTLPRRTDVGARDERGRGTCDDQSRCSWCSSH